MSPDATATPTSTPATPATPAGAGESRFDGVGPGTGPTTSPDTLAAALESLSTLGASATQLTAGGWDVVMDGRVFGPRLARYRAVAEGFGLRYTLHAPIAELNLVAPDHAFQEQQFGAWLEVAATLGCRTMTYHPGRFDPARLPGATAADALAREREALARLAHRAGRLGVRIACENLVTQTWWPEGQRQHSCDPQWLVDLVEAVDHPYLAVCFDLGHLLLSSVVEGYDYLTAARRLIPHAVVLHVHDNFGKPTRSPVATGGAGPAMQLVRGEGDLHMPPGWGAVPLEATFGAGGFARQPVLVLEMEARYWRDDPQVVRDSLAAGARLTSLAGPAAG